MTLTRVDQNGRVLLPAAIRRALGLLYGSELLVTLEEDGRVVLTTPATAWTRVQALFNGAAPPRSVVDELLDERREEARREANAGTGNDLLGA